MRLGIWRFWNLLRRTVDEGTFRLFVFSLPWPMNGFCSNGHQTCSVMPSCLSRVHRMTGGSRFKIQERHYLLRDQLSSIDVRRLSTDSRRWHTLRRSRPDEQIDGAGSSNLRSSSGTVNEQLVESALLSSLLLQQTAQRTKESLKKSDQIAVK